MSRTYDTAAEFCEIAGAPDLLEYLQVDPEVDPEEVQEKLKARRKYMQGMQSNPKYRKEALFLIKHFKELSEALADPRAYQLDALRRAESVHLPILEMTVKGVLAGGRLSADQETYLQRNAHELGVSDATFEALLDRLAREAGVKRVSGARTLTPTTAPPIRAVGDDFYRLLGIERGASLPEIRAAYESQMAAARSRAQSPEIEALIVRLDLAWSVLSDPRAREKYHITQTRTGPPARAREAGPEGDTAPPVRRKPGGAPTLPVGPAYTPPGGGGSRLEVMGEPVRSVSLGRGDVATTVRIRNGGSEAMTGRISCDQPWVSLNPRQIDPTLGEQDIHVTLHGDRLDGSSGSATVTIVTDRGERAAVTFHVSRSRMGLLIGAAVTAVLLVVGLGFAYTATRPPSALEITVDPWAEEVVIEGRALGSGNRFVVPRPAGPSKVTVTQPNFKPAEVPITEEVLNSGALHIQLQQSRRLNFVPKDQLRRTSVPQDEASRLFQERSSTIDACIRKLVKPDSVLTGSIKVHIDRDGLAAGLEAQGKHTDEPAVAECLERQAAALSFPPLANGDYATVRYEYTVTAERP